MIEVILNRVLVELEEIKKTHKVCNIEIAIAYGEMEKRHNASVTQGVVISIVPMHTKTMGISTLNPFQWGIEFSSPSLLRHL